MLIYFYIVVKFQTLFGVCSEHAKNIAVQINLIRVSIVDMCGQGKNGYDLNCIRKNHLVLTNLE